LLVNKVSTQVTYRYIHSGWYRWKMHETKD